MLDGSQIKQMLVNLVQNAIDAVAGPGEVRIAVRLRDRGVEIRVADDGCGIPRSHLNRVFTPFFTTNETGKGTGLGLAIAYGVVKMHCGEIAVDSEEGKGSEFRIWLPAE